MKAVKMRKINRSGMHFLMCLVLRADALLTLRSPLKSLTAKVVYRHAVARAIIG